MDIACRAVIAGGWWALLALGAAACVAPEPSDDPEDPGDSAAGPVDGPGDTSSTDPGLPGEGPLSSPDPWWTPDCDATPRLCRADEGALGLLSEGPSYGRGGAVVDIDGDGWEDIWQVDTTPADPTYPRQSALFRNNADGTFTALDLGLPRAPFVYNWTGTWADFDRDGDPDLFSASGGFSGEGHVGLFRNDLSDGGGLVDVSAEAGITDDACHWWCPSAADYDGDGWLDVVVVPLNEASDDCPECPTSECDLRLYHNDGDGTFTEVAAAAGVDTPYGNLKNPVWWDHDDDGDLDLYIASLDSRVAPPATPDHARLFRNDGDGTFTDVTTEVLPPEAYTLPVFAVSAADFDQDGLDDLYIGRETAQDYVLLNRGEDGFEVRGREHGLDMTLGVEGFENAMGLTVFDLQGDGWPDVVLGPGTPAIPNPPLAYCHTGDPDDVRFTRCSEPFLQGHVSSWNHAILPGDFDRDGDLDVFWNLGGDEFFDRTQGAESRVDPAFYVNRTPDRPPVVGLRLVGTVSNPDAIGAHVIVKTPTRDVHQRVRPMQGFQTQKSPWLTVVTGTLDPVEVEVRWPSGVVSTHVVAAEERVVVVEPGG